MITKTNWRFICQNSRSLYRSLLIFLKKNLNKKRLKPYSHNDRFNKTTLPFPDAFFNKVESKPSLLRLHQSAQDEIHLAFFFKYVMEVDLKDLYAVYKDYFITRLTSIQTQWL